MSLCDRSLLNIQSTALKARLVSADHQKHACQCSVSDEHVHSLWCSVLYMALNGGWCNSFCVCSSYSNSQSMKNVLIDITTPFLSVTLPCHYCQSAWAREVCASQHDLNQWTTRSDLLHDLIVKSFTAAINSKHSLLISNSNLQFWLNSTDSLTPS